MSSLDEQWDVCVENTAVNVAKGGIFGAAIGFIFFRSFASRTALTGLGVGTGFGLRSVSILSRVDIQLLHYCSVRECKPVMYATLSQPPQIPIITNQIPKE